MQMSSSECRAVETLKHLLACAQERGGELMFRKPACNQSKLLILERKHVLVCMTNLCLVVDAFSSALLWT